MIIRFAQAFACIILLCVSVQVFCFLSGYQAFDNRAAATQTALVQSKEVTDGLPAISKDVPELVLVNKSVRLNKDYEPSDLALVKGVYLREMAAAALGKMLSAAEHEGVKSIVAVSGYRSYATQLAVYSNKIARLRSEYGDSAQAEAEKLVAPAGASEHQTGLAVDLSITEFLSYEYVLNYDFASTAAGRWLSQNAWQYGFILRYAEDKEEKTGFSYEPWHFRYVGAEHAKAMFEKKLCLEEYLTK